MEPLALLIILQIVAALSFRYLGTSLFPDGPHPNFGNLPEILRNPLVLNTLGIGAALVSVAVAVCGFVFTDYPWWLLLFVVASFIWASPPYRNRPPV